MSSSEVLQIHIEGLTVRAVYEYFTKVTHPVLFGTQTDVLTLHIEHCSMLNERIGRTVIYLNVISKRKYSVLQFSALSVVLVGHLKANSHIAYRAHAMR
jgi:hypothetical protein